MQTTHRRLRGNGHRFLTFVEQKNLKKRCLEHLKLGMGRRVKVTVMPKKEPPTELLTSLCSTSSLVNSMASSLNGSATCTPVGVFLELRGHSIPAGHTHTHAGRKSQAANHDTAQGGGDLKQKATCIISISVRGRGVIAGKEPWLSSSWDICRDS